RLLDRRRDGEVLDRPVDRLLNIFAAKPEIGLLERLPVGAELEHVAQVRLEIRVAAGDRSHEHRLTGGEVEDSRARSFERRIAELVDGRRTFLAGPAGD